MSNVILPWMRMGSRLPLAIMVMAGLALRLGLALPGLLDNPAERFSRPDTGTYLGPALSLARSGTYMEAPGSEIPATTRPPVFPAALALVFVVLGEGLTAPVVLLCLLGAATAIPVFLVGRELASPRIGLLAAGLWTLNATAIANSPMLLTDTPFAFLVAWQVYFLCRFHRRPGWGPLMAIIAIAGAGTLTRPINLPWILPAAFLVLIQPGLTWPRRLAMAAASALLFLAIITPWMWRNQRVGAGFRIDSNIGDTLYRQNCAYLLARATGEPADAIRERHGAAAAAEFAAHPERYPTINHRLAWMTGEARAIIRQHPLLYLRLHVQPMILLPDLPTAFELLGITRTGQNTLDVLHRKGLLAAVRHYFGGRIWPLAAATPALAVVTALYLGALIQLGRWLLARQWWLCFLFLACVQYYLLLPGPIIVPRYHLPALPLLCAMAAMGLAEMALRGSGHGEDQRK